MKWWGWVGFAIPVLMISVGVVILAHDALSLAVWQRWIFWSAFLMVAWMLWWSAWQ